MGALLSAKRRLRPRERAAGGGWRNERDANGAANVTFGAPSVTPYIGASVLDRADVRRLL